MTTQTDSKVNHGKTSLEVRDLEIVMKRVFDAPRELVWEVMTTPEHQQNWWGPRKMTTEIVHYDLRPGGSYRFINRDGDQAFVFKGEIREVVKPEKIVQTFGMEGFFEGKTIVETALLEEIDGKTHFTNISRFESNEDRDGMLSTGMETGASESYDRLDEILASLK